MAEEKKLLHCICLQRDFPLCSKFEARFGCSIVVTPVCEGGKLTLFGCKGNSPEEKFLILPEHAKSGKSWWSGNTQNPLKIHNIIYYTGTALCVAQSKLLFQARKCFLNILSPWQSSLGLKFWPWLLQKTPMKSNVLYSLLPRPGLLGRLTWQCSHQHPLGPLCSAGLSHPKLICLPTN